MVEREPHFAPVDLQRLIERARNNHVFLAVVTTERPAGQSAANVKFILGMDVTRLVERHCIDDDSHACVGNQQRFGLCFAQLRPAIATGWVVIGPLKIRQLYEIEGHLVLLPNLSPAEHKGRHFVVIAFPFAPIGFTLIPKHSLNREARERMNHGVVHLRPAIAPLCPTQLGHQFDTGRRNPRLNLAATPTVIEQPDRDACFGLHIAGKIKSDSRKAASGLRCAHLPRCRGRSVLLWVA